MSLLLDCLALRAHQHPDAVLLDDGARSVSASEITAAVTCLRDQIRAMNSRSVAIVGDNSLAWILCDLALLGLPVRVVPIPAFFSMAQIKHVLQEAAIDTLIGTAGALATVTFHNNDRKEKENAEAVPLLPEFNVCAVRAAPLAGGVPAADIKHYEKVTFTSGSTGNAKGVRLSLDMLERTAQSIAAALAPLEITSHLGVLPYATLLENVAGIYAPLLQGVTIHVRGMAQLGLSSPEQFNPFLLLGEIQKVKPQATILVPQLLLALVSLGERGLTVGDAFRFIAVGGGKVACSLIDKAKTLGLPVYEGYGLSECGSVVTLNLPGNNRPGSTGRPLSHSTIRLADDGEIMVKGAVMSGYLNEPDLADSAEIATGDIGFFDDEGYLHVSGRKKNMFITAFGRNVNPEWVEAELLRHLPIRQVSVFGEALPQNVAIIVARNGFTQQDVDAAVEHCNQSLPDYARIGHIVMSPFPFTTDNDMATANGRLRRVVIEKTFSTDIEQAHFSVEKQHAIL